MQKIVDFDEKFAAFMIEAQAVVDRTYAQFNRTEIGVMRAPKLETEPGKRYVRIVSVSPGSRSAWAFVDMTNGFVMKADGWKRPAKGPRGSIFDQHKGCNRATRTGVRWSPVDSQRN